MAQRDEYQMRLIRVMEEEWKGGQAKGPAFPRLITTGRLAEKLKGSYRDGVEILRGPEATEPELRKRPLREYGYQLFATHGILDGEVPYIREPALVLSQVGVNSQERERNGFLTLTEVMELKRDAEIAALTACNTGVGKNQTGEGVMMGLGRAFQYAGARAVLMNLWSVEDESNNHLLTEKFFGHLKAGADRLEALRLARAELRQAGYEHPFYWVLFILVGER